MKPAITPSTASSDNGAGRPSLTLWWAAAALIAPVLLLQALWLRWRVPRLPAAGGDIAGQCPPLDETAPERPPLRLLVIGESTAAGVGADSHHQGFVGHTAGALAASTGRSVSWEVFGISGITAAELRSELRRQPAGATLPLADILCVVLGVNDTLRLRSARAWRRDYLALVGDMQKLHPGASVVCSGVPPLHRFPALPQPLRFMAAWRGRQMDRVLQSLAASQGWRHVSVPNLNGDHPGHVRHQLFSPDGFHPSPAGYQRWCEDLVQSLLLTSGILSAQ